MLLFEIDSRYTKYSNITLHYSILHTAYLLDENIIIFGYFFIAFLGREKKLPRNIVVCRVLARQRQPRHGKLPRSLCDRHQALSHTCGWSDWFGFLPSCLHLIFNLAWQGRGQQQLRHGEVLWRSQSGWLQGPGGSAGRGGLGTVFPAAGLV